jgi:hypothetical protein
MDRVIDVRPGARFAFAFAVDLGDTAVRMAFRWLDAPGVWSWQAYTIDGNALTPQLLVRAGGEVPPVPGIPGRLRWSGPDEYAREDLGASLRLLWTPP